MRYIEADRIDEIRGERIGETQTFSFRCHESLACFNTCCRNLNLFLYPYDVVRLKNHLGISSSQFLDSHVDIVLRETNYFPDVLLRMAENEEKTCPFLLESGCSVYGDRPGTCRMFPVEPGIYYDAGTGATHSLHFFRPPSFCLGQEERQVWTIQAWQKSQNASPYSNMAVQWADLKRRFQNDPWGEEGPGGQKGKMAFMAAYNVDSFRDFLFKSSFLRRYRVPPPTLKKIRTNDRELLLLGFEWISSYLWGIPSKKIMLR